MLDTNVDGCVGEGMRQGEFPCCWDHILTGEEVEMDKEMDGCRRIYVNAHQSRR